jgi:hypothetical protein
MDMMMKKKIISGLLCLATVYTFGQDVCRYYSGEKVCYEISATKMLVRLKTVDNTEAEKVLKNLISGNVKKIDDLGGFFLVEMENTSKEDMRALQRQLNAKEDIMYVSPVYLDGVYEESFTNKIIIRLKSNDDYPVLQKCADIYLIKEIRRLYKDVLFIGDELVYILTLPHNSEKDAMTIACELYETGLFQHADPNYISLFPFDNGSNRNITPEQTILFYPNPVSHILYIDLETVVRTQNKTSASYDIRLYNSLGIMYRQAKATGGIVEINVSNLPGGIYFLNIYGGNASKPEAHKIIVKH